MCRRTHFFFVYDVCARRHSLCLLSVVSVRFSDFFFPWWTFVSAIDHPDQQLGCTRRGHQFAAANRCEKNTAKSAYGRNGGGCHRDVISCDDELVTEAPGLERRCQPPVPAKVLLWKSSTVSNAPPPLLLTMSTPAFSRRTIALEVFGRQLDCTHSMYVCTRVMCQHQSTGHD